VIAVDVVVDVVAVAVVVVVVVVVVEVKNWNWNLELAATNHHKSRDLLRVGSNDLGIFFFCRSSPPSTNHMICG
jgi:hypothetical protein